jgi:hypothetical protein
MEKRQGKKEQKKRTGKENGKREWEKRMGKENGKNRSGSTTAKAS